MSVGKKRKAVITVSGDIDDATRGIRALLPDNYAITNVGEAGLSGRLRDVTIEGTDRLGWTLEHYVLPRLASGLFFGSEVFD